MGGGGSSGGGGGAVGGGGGRTGGGRGGGISIAPRCSEAQSLLRIDFRPEASLDAMEATNPEELARKLSGTTPDKPLMLFLTSRNPKDQRAVTLVEQGTFSDERVALGTKFFRVVRMVQDEIAKEHPLADLIGGQAMPRVVLISRDGKTAKKLEGRIGATGLFSAMSAVVAEDCNRKLDTFVREMRKVLNDLEEVARDRNQLERKTNSMLKKGNDVKAAKEVKKDQELLEKKKAEMAQRLEELLRWTVPATEATAKGA